MIEAHDVAQVEVGAQPVDPPSITLGMMDVPGVEGISPKLAVGREIIRRNAGDEKRVARLRVELKEMRVRPHVGAVARHKDRSVADQLDVQLPRLGANLLPLAEE